MKEALKEYGELCKLSGKWMKKHWKGYLAFCVGIWTTTYLWLSKDIIKARLKTTKKSDEEEA